MTPTPTSIVAKIGRGIAYPLHFSGGSTNWNIPDAPTEAEAEAAAISAMRTAVCTPLGSAFHARTELGSEAPRHIAEVMTDATANAAAATARGAIAGQVPFVRLLGPFAPVYNDETGGLSLYASYAFRGSSRSRDAAVVVKEGASG